MMDMNTELLAAEDFNQPETEVERQPTHMVGLMIKGQREILDNQVAALAKLEKEKNERLRRLNESYGKQIANAEENAKHIMAMMQSNDEELVVLRKELRSSKAEVAIKFAEDKASQKKIIAGLRALIADLEKPI